MSLLPPISDASPWDNHAEDHEAEREFVNGIATELETARDGAPTLADRLLELEGGAGADLSDADPQPLGIDPDPGIDEEGARADHVHPLPTATDVGAATTAELADEETQRLAGDSALSDALDAETLARQAVASDLADETTARTDADAALASDIDDANTATAAVASDLATHAGIVDGTAHNIAALIAAAVEAHADIVDGSAHGINAIVAQAIDDLVAAAPGTLDTLNELAAALADDPNFASTMSAALAGKQPLAATLTALAGLATTAFGRGFLTLADTAAVFTYLGLGTAATKNVPASGNAASGEVVLGNDGRLTDARTPTAHHATHEAGGTDPITLTMAAVTGLVTALAGKVDVGGVRTWDATTGNLVGLASDRLIIQIGDLTSSGGTYFLPDAAAVPANTGVIIIDASGTVDDVAYLFVATSAGTGDTIPGAASYGVSFVGITNPYGMRQFRSDGANLWLGVDLAVTTDPDLPGGDATLATCDAVLGAIANAIAALPDITEIGFGTRTTRAGDLLTIDQDPTVDWEELIRSFSPNMLRALDGTLDANGNRIQDLATPVLDADAARLSDINAALDSIRLVDGTANVTMAATDRRIIFTGLTASRNVTLPDGSSVRVGYEVAIQDASGLASPGGSVGAVRSINILRAGSDIIAGGDFSGTVTYLANPYGEIRLRYEGGGVWAPIAAPLHCPSNLADVLSAPAGRYNLHDQVLAAVKAVATSNVSSLSGTTTIDGVSLVAGDYVLLTGQTTGSQNGPWVVSASGWTRPPDYPAGGTVISRIVFVTDGNFAGSLWASLTSAAVTIDTTATVWVRTNPDGLIGWQISPDVWTRTANTTFTTPSDKTARYRPGTKVSWAESGVTKYGVVASSAFASGTTTVTLMATSDYVMAASPDTATAKYSYGRPQGFPAAFTWAPTDTGFSAAPNHTAAWWSVENGRCTVLYFCFTDGTSNATTYTVTLPIACYAATNGHIGRGKDNGTAVIVNGAINAGTTLTLTQGAGAAAWTASGSKSAQMFITYPIAT